MKNNNVIDLRDYFAQNAAPAEATPVLPKLLHTMGRALDIAATAAITLCVCTCTLLFFTML